MFLVLEGLGMMSVDFRLRNFSGFPPPPGARFDPYGPGVGFPSGPRPDHLRPPDWDDSMFG